MTDRSRRQQQRATLVPVCAHATDPLLVTWYAKHSEVTCARCWFETQRSLGTATVVIKTTRRSDATSNVVSQHELFAKRSPSDARLHALVPERLLTDQRRYSTLDVVRSRGPPR